MEAVDHKQQLGGIDPYRRAVNRARLDPPELLGESREGLETIPLALLRQPPPPAYKLAPGDVLGIWIEGILGEKISTKPVEVLTPFPWVRGERGARVLSK